MSGASVSPKNMYCLITAPYRVLIVKAFVSDKISLYTVHLIINFKVEKHDFKLILVRIWDVRNALEKSGTWDHK